MWLFNKSNRKPCKTTSPLSLLFWTTPYARKLSLRHRYTSYSRRFVPFTWSLDRCPISKCRKRNHGEIAGCLAQKNTIGFDSTDHCISQKHGRGGVPRIDEYISWTLGQRHLLNDLARMLNFTFPFVIIEHTGKGVNFILGTKQCFNNSMTIHVLTLETAAPLTAYIVMEEK